MFCPYKRVSGKKHEIFQVKAQLQAQAKVAYLSQKYQNEMADELQIRGQAIRDDWSEVRQYIFAFCLTASQLAATSQTSNLPPILTLHRSSAELPVVGIETTVAVSSRL